MFLFYSMDSSERRSRCVKETEELFAPAVTNLFIKAKGVKESEAAVEQVEDMVHAMKVRQCMQCIG